MSMSMNTTESVAAAWMAGNETYAMGAQFMGALFDSLFAGVILCQLTHWIPHAKNDNRTVQVLVALGSAGALGATIFTWANYMMSFVYEFGQYEQFTTWKMLGWYPTLDALTVIPVQTFFAERAFRINNNSLLIGLVCFLLISATAASAISITIITRHQTLMHPTDSIRILSVLWPTICTTAHGIITLSIITGLLRARSTGDGGAKLVHRVMAVCLESQFPATVVAIAAMTTIATNPSGPLIPFICIVHPKIFMVGCLAMVNIRHTWRLTGKVPSTYKGSSRGSALSALNSQSSSKESEGPRTPRGGSRTVTVKEEQEFKYNFEMGDAMAAMGHLRIKQPGEA